MTMTVGFWTASRVLEGLGVSDDAIARRLDHMREEGLGRISGRDRRKTGRPGRGG